MAPSNKDLNRLAAEAAQAGSSLSIRQVLAVYQASCQAQKPLGLQDPDAAEQVRLAPLRIAAHAALICADVNRDISRMKAVWGSGELLQPVVESRELARKFQKQVPREEAKSAAPPAPVVPPPSRAAVAPPPMPAPASAPQGLNPAASNNTKQRPLELKPISFNASAGEILVNFKVRSGYRVILDFRTDRFPESPDDRHGAVVHRDLVGALHQPFHSVPFQREAGFLTLWAIPDKGGEPYPTQLQWKRPVMLEYTLEKGPGGKEASLKIKSNEDAQVSGLVLVGAIGPNVPMDGPTVLDSFPLDDLFLHAGQEFSVSDIPYKHKGGYYRLHHRPSNGALVPSVIFAKADPVILS